MKEPNPVGRQLAPLIFFIVLVIVLTLIIRGSRLPEKPEENAVAGSQVEMRLSPFSFDDLSDKGDPDAQLAREMLIYGIKKYIGSYAAAMLLRIP